MKESFELFFHVGLPLLLIILGLVVGTLLEKKHYASIRLRESNTKNLPVLTLSQYQGSQTILKSHLVTGSVVISVDYFKRILASIRNIFGGKVYAYESLVDRARREAILRMKAKCPAANMIINLKIETSSISKQSRAGQRSIGCVEVIAYGTAIHFQ